MKTIVTSFNIDGSIKGSEPPPPKKRGLKPYHVTYFYLATGMEGIADTRDYGVVWAEDNKDAIKRVSKIHGSDWGLSARRV